MRYEYELIKFVILKYQNTSNTPTLEYPHPPMYVCLIMHSVFQY